MIRLVAGAIVLLSLGRGWAEETAPSIEVDPSRVIRQQEYPDSINACGPTSILNMVEFGGEKLQPLRDSVIGSDQATRIRYVVDKYFRNRNSVTYPGWRRWGVQGVASADLAVAVQELFSENGLSEPNASFLDREEDETAAEHQERVHDWIGDSIRAGMPPILSLRSYAVREQEGDKPAAWKPVRQHFVVVTGLKSARKPGVAGFTANVIDPNKGKITEIHFFTEPHGQNFRAMKGVEEQNQWLEGKPFILVNAPEIVSLRPANLKWSERFIVVANFLVGDF